MNTHEMSQIIIGIRYTRTFKISDCLGAIADTVLNGEQSPFGTSFFPKIEWLNNSDMRLINEDTGNYFRVNSDDLIFRISSSGDLSKDLKEIQGVYLPFFEKSIFGAYDMENIRRLGIIFSQKLTNLKKFEEKFVSAFIKDTNTVENISMGFSKKMPVKESLTKKGVNDYRKAIYSFKTDENNALSADLDFQHYFDPPVQKIRDCSLNDFIASAEGYFGTTYLPWLKELINYEEK